MMIGKWSLPKRSSIRFQVVIGVREGEQKLRSMCVKVLCVVKCVGDLSFSRVSCDCSMYLAIVFPLEFECVDPQFWCQLLKSPVIMTVSLLMLITLFRLLREKDLLGEI